MRYRIILLKGKERRKLVPCRDDVVDETLEGEGEEDGTWHLLLLFTSDLERL